MFTRFVEVTPHRVFALGVALIALGCFLSPVPFGGFIVIGAALVWYAFDLTTAEEDEDVAEPPTPRRPF